MTYPAPRFTGIFIPVEILELTSLSLLDQTLLSWIDALFCKKHGGCFASNEYFSLKLRVKPNTIVKSITKLRKMKLIEDVSFDGRKRVIKSKIWDYVNESQKPEDCDLNHTQGMTKIPPSMGKKSQASTKNIHITSYSKDEDKEESRCALSQDSLRLSSLLFQKIKENNPRAKEPKLEEWAKDIDKTHTLDGYTWELIENVILFSQASDFWRMNILSGKKLRKQMPVLYLALKNDPYFRKKVNPIDPKKAKQCKESAEYYLQGYSTNYTQIFDDRVEIKCSGTWKTISFSEPNFDFELKKFIELAKLKRV